MPRKTGHTLEGQPRAGDIPPLLPVDESFVGRQRCSGRVSPSQKPKMVVLTGGPGAGKTAVLRIARQAMCQHVVVLPEAATVVFSGGFWRRSTTAARRAAQRSIFHVQRELETLVFDDHLGALVLCDRGTVDGLAYWPGNAKEYWRQLGTTHEDEMVRYDGVIHLCTPEPHNGYNHDNPIRLESADEAAEIDHRLQRVWAKHPHRYIIEPADDFFVKAHRALDLIAQFLPKPCRACTGFKLA